MGKKIVVVAVGVVVVVIVAAVLLVGSHLDRYVDQAIEDYGRATTGTDVSLGSVDLAPTKGTGELKRLTIDNPPGYATPYALRIDDIKLTLDLGSLATNVPVVKEVVVDSAHLNAEQRGDSTNLTDIEHNMGKASGSASAAPEEQGKVIIERFRLTNGRVTLTSELLSHPEDLALEDVVVQGVGRSTGGATYDEATAAVLNPILAAARTAVEKRLKEAAAGAARDEVKKKAADRLKGLLDR